MGPPAGAGAHSSLTEPSRGWLASISESRPSGAPLTVTVTLPGPVLCGADRHTASFLSFILKAVALLRGLDSGPGSVTPDHGTVCQAPARALVSSSIK